MIRIPKNCIIIIIKKASISPEIPIAEVQKSWFAEPETFPNGSPTVRVALQEPKTVTQPEVVSNEVVILK